MEARSAGRSNCSTLSAVELQNDLMRFVQETGAFALPALFSASLLEALVPPFPGDTIIVLGAFYAVQGHLPWAAVFLAVTAGNLIGSAVAFVIGVRLGRAAERRLPEHRERRRLLSLDQLHRFEAAYRRHGDLFILVNRFLPGVRGFFFVAAGMSGMRMPRTLALGAVSAAAWNTGLLALGWAVGENLDRLAGILRTYGTIAWIALGLAALGVALRFALRRWARGAPGSRSGS